jgi:hypothetical protein
LPAKKNFPKPILSYCCKKTIADWRKKKKDTIALAADNIPL